MAIGKYEPLVIEPKILSFWEKHKLREKINKRNKKGKQFYFLDGPPYTSGQIHLGTAWNKALKDCVLRYKRMQGFDVYDRAGYDMHGLPIEHKVEAKFNIKNKDEIPSFGVERYIEECRKFSLENMNLMNKDFQRLGAWMDFDHAYTPITEQSIEAIWWLIKKAHEQKRLYEGERAMSWCSTCATALAKHELEYKNIDDLSVYLKFKLKTTKNKESNEYLVIWTTTPWTIPLNLAAVVHPKFYYAKLKVGNEYWIMAKELVGKVMNEIGAAVYEEVETFLGEKLAGKEYIPPFPDEFTYITDAQKTQKKIYTILLSEEYVNLEDGTGIVHFAPGCGESDYELCIREGIKPFNVLDEYGVYPKEHSTFGGLVAKKDDKEFAQLIDKNNSLIFKARYNHSYAHCWRCHNPIIYRTTKQWFFKIEDLKEQMIHENKTNIHWVPDSAFNAFDAWLVNLRDNSITKQRYWGTPLPVWQCKDCRYFEVLSTKKEIEEKCKIKLKDLHKPWIDEAQYPCKQKTSHGLCKGIMNRIPDVMDVWIDPGCASWISLDYPSQQELFTKLFPADFILEGKDQIRGWFNVLMVCSMLGMRKISFKNVYMHGFVQDSLGRKMSKSLGNVISPSEVIDKYGVDTFRFYAIGGAKPMLDLNYNFEDMKIKNKNLDVFWNLHKLLIDMKTAHNLELLPLDRKEKKELDLEDRYILSRLHATIKKVTEKYDQYLINEIPWIIEELFLELSRTYIQTIRDRFALGEKEIKQVVLRVFYHVYFDCLKMFATVCPFVSEEIYQNLKEIFKLKEQSIHESVWPAYDEKQIDEKLEREFVVAKDTMQSILSAREKAQLGVRWPLKKVVIVTMDEEIKSILTFMESIIATQTNVKFIEIVKSFDKMSIKVKPNYKSLGPTFGNDVPKIISALLTENEHTLIKHIDKEGSFKLKVGAKTFNVTKDHLVFEKTLPANYISAEYKYGDLLIDIERTPELDGEGYSREIIRRVQEMRKKQGLQRQNLIKLSISTDENLCALMSSMAKEIKE
ncbi:isoleucine--tRNA ligase [Candidatus Woesearchaeota archaeon]|nr:isoleucine--tRNA ligase [Candidatus Woesearchaeota archaeon]